MGTSLISALRWPAGRAWYLVALLTTAHFFTDMIIMLTGLVVGPLAASLLLLSYARRHYVAEARQPA